MSLLDYAKTERQRKAIKAWEVSSDWVEPSEAAPE